MMKYIIIGIATVFALYGLLVAVAPMLADIFLTLAITIGTVAAIAYFGFRKQLFGLSIWIVPAKYHTEINTIKNESCTVRYFPGERIIVADNSAKNECNKRYFVLQKGAVDVEFAWFQICQIYNRYSTLGSLSEFFKKTTAVDIKVEQDEAKPKKRVIEKTEYRNPESSLPKPKISAPEIVEFDKLQTKNMAQTTTKDEEMQSVEEFLNMGDIMKQSAQKVNINTATAGEIAVLHGINIAIAKKIVEYRNLNGNFKTIEEFLEVAEVKEHFIPQIKDLVTLDGNDDNGGHGDAPNEGRLLDW